MEAFFADVATVKSILGDVRKKLVKLNKLNDESKTATRTETMKRYRDEMNGVIEEVSTTARECKLRLENLDRANEEAAKGAGAGPGSPLFPAQSLHFGAFFASRPASSA